MKSDRLKIVNSQWYSGNNKFFPKGVGIQEYMIAYHSLPETATVDTTGLGIEFQKLKQRLDHLKASGFNHLRVSIKKWKWYDTENDYRYKLQLDFIVSYAEQIGLYVYFCLHYGANDDIVLLHELMADHNFDGWLDWVKDISTRYKDYKSFFGIMNWAEPKHDYTLISIADLEPQWRAYQQSFINAVRTVSQDIICIIPSCGYYSRKKVSDFIMNNPYTGGNVAYTFTDYHAWFSGAYGVAMKAAYENPDRTGIIDNTVLTAKEIQKLWLIEKGGKMIINNKGAVIVSEFGFDMDLDTYSMFPESEIALDFYDLCDEIGIGITQWCFSRRWTHTDGWYLVEDNMTTYTPAGVLLKDWIPTQGGYSPTPEQPEESQNIIAVLIGIFILVVSILLGGGM